MNDEQITSLLCERAEGIDVPSSSAAQARRRARQRDLRVNAGIGLGTVGLLAVGVVALADGRRGGSVNNPGGPPDMTMTTATVPPATSTVPAVVHTHLDRDLATGSYGEDVKALQTRLSELGFDTHGVDGQFSTGTEMAVWAFEGLVLGRGYAEQTGVVTDEMWQRMQDPFTVTARRAEVAGGATHVEIYLPLQVLAVFTDGKVRLITHISSGDGETWCEVVSINADEQGNPINPPQLTDICGVSKTPGGVFHFYRERIGHRMSARGGMDNPVYFNYGIAVHGADNVPKEPGSYGTIRIPQWVATYFPALVTAADQDNGDRVYVWGMDGKEPEEYSADEMLPVFAYPNPNSTLTTTP